VNDGNELYHQKQYDKAKEKYSSAAKLDPTRIESQFNLGNAEYRSDNFKGAIERYKKAGERASSKEEGGQLWYNGGTTFLNAVEKGAGISSPSQSADQGQEMKMQGYQQAIDAYKQSLKLNPKDADARYNLLYAMKKLDEMKQQQKNKYKDDKKQKKNEKQDKNKDDQKKNKDQQQKQDKQDKKDDKEKQQQNQKQNDQQNKANKNQEKQKPKPQEEKKMSQQQAEQILRALQRNEQDLQKKLRAKQSVRVQVEKDW